MAIRRDSGAAMNVVACDPADRGDWESATKICDRIDATLVKLVNAGHGSVKCVSRTAIFGNIVTAALSNDPVALADIVRQTRRNAPARAITISHGIAARKPRTAFAIYTKYKALFPVAHRASFLFKLRKSALRRQCFREMAAIYDSQKHSHGYLAVLALFLNDMGRKPEALSCLERAIALHDQPSYHFLKKQISG
ncbi:hypothetical protein [Tropicibacter oceani]|uniref:Tetratricopeptide repeat protein n=1 Tax=Tropicibacter oceani TaxID=3058420 RepID=A0ABY8QLK6_9RHOB|nr:hypothetical protein [Tropicibacter oceani]WGW04883.1 hypothetical protein QF118_04870 [Tropicibacter oceani]